MTEHRVALTDDECIFDGSAFEYIPDEVITFRWGVSFEDLPDGKCLAILTGGWKDPKVHYTKVFETGPQASLEAWKVISGKVLQGAPSFEGWEEKMV